MARRSRKIYCFGDSEFTSQEAARKFFTGIRNGLEAGETVTIPAHVAALVDLFRGHAEYAEKAGCGVLRFYVDYAPDHPNTTCFWIERHDGSITDFGFNACIQTIGGLNRQSFRCLVRPQISEYRQRRLYGGKGTFVSDFSGLEFSVTESHVDHEVEFEEIVRQFALQEGFDIEAEMLTVTCDAKSEPTWRDKGVAQRFLAFHSRFPLRLVSQRENLSDLKRARKG